MNAVDIFSGAGGFTEGAALAGVNVECALNHYPPAVEYHSRNHPHAAHLCQDARQANWLQLPSHDALLASPSCTGHTPARGKDRPVHEAARATAWAVVDCAEVHRPELVIVENVPAFMTKWILYPAWLHAMQSLGYSVAPHIIDAADHGVPQNRVRVFFVCTRSKTPLHLTLEKEAHIAVNSVIEWDAHQWSQINRAGRKPATLRRIENGRAAFGSRFVAPYYKSGSGLTGRSIHRPIGTLTTKDRWAVVDGDRMRMLQVPEAKAIMGFRPDYILPSNHKDAMQMLGNAVCPPVVRKLLRSIQMAC